MALIGTIRKNYWFVLILLGLALLAFILMDVMSNNNRTSAGGQSIGYVAGQKINQIDFNRTQSALFGGGGDANVSANATWNYYTEKAIIDNEADKLGLGVSKEELLDLEFGANLSPIIQQNFRDQRTGQVNYQTLMTYKTAIEEGNFTNPDLRSFWSEQEKQIVKTKKQDKIVKIVEKGIYTPTWMVEHTYGQNNVKADLELVKIPFTAINDSDVEVTDADISSYISNNAAIYNVEEETRVGEYLVINIEASEEDKQNLLSTFNETITSFRAAENDSLFAVANQGTSNNYYFKKSELPDSLQNNIGAMKVGDVYGPYLENELGYTATKLVDTKVIPDSVQARHILRAADGSNPNALVQASMLIDSLKTELEAGRGDFAALATSFSQDPGSAAKGGDLGYFVQNTMVPGFKDACFYYGKEGGYYKVQTQFGVHLIHIQDQKYLNREPKYKIANISKLIVPSEETIQSAIDKAADLASENRDLESLRAAIESDEDITLETSSPFKINDYNFAPLGGGSVGRNMVRWMYDEDVSTGELSPEIYEFINPQTSYVNKAVLLGLKSILPAGLPTGESARGLVEGLVRNQKKGAMLARKINTTDLSALASQYGTTVENIAGFSLADAFNPILGNEPEVAGIAVNQEANTTSKPTVGQGGIYVVKTTAKSAAPAPTNIPQLRSGSSQTMRNGVSFGLMDALKNAAEIEDSRFEVGM